MPQENIALMAHLLRRAGFGANRDELERYAAKGYEATVEELLHPEHAPPGLDDDDLLRRYHVDQNSFAAVGPAQAGWLYRMINTRRPLEEKIALFWHGVFATGWSKLQQTQSLVNQVDMLRRYGLGSFRVLLLQVSMDPAMLFWLDNTDNHKDAVNENYGRELLELFSLGVGNYSEDDVRQASRAFTGWTVRDVAIHAFRIQGALIGPYGYGDWDFEYRQEDHDDVEKTFLGETREFDGQDIIDAICRQPATAMFVARHLYNYFVADEPQVSAWETVPPRDPEAIRTLTDAFVGSEYDMRSVLRVLFNSDFFKESEFARVKSPAELIAGTVRLAGGHRFPELATEDLAIQCTEMGQALMDPPSVEGWHTGKEWINTANLARRADFAVGQFSDARSPGVTSIIDRVQARRSAISPEEMVETCLDLIGPLTVSEGTMAELLAHARAVDDVRVGPPEIDCPSAESITGLLQLIVSTPEYQMV